jgi:hypothetical protein
MQRRVQCQLLCAGQRIEEFVLLRHEADTTRRKSNCAPSMRDFGRMWR